MPWRICDRCLQAQTKGSAISCGTPHHQPGAAAIRDFLVWVIEAAMLEGPDSLGRAGLALAYRQDLRFRPDRITGKDRTWEFGVLHAEISDCRAQGGVLHRQANDQAEGEDRIHQRFAEFG